MEKSSETTEANFPLDSKSGEAFWGKYKLPHSNTAATLVGMSHTERDYSYILIDDDDFPCHHVSCDSHIEPIENGEK